MNHPILQGVAWGLFAALASAVPRYTYQADVPRDEQILEIVQRIDQRLDKPAVMQQTNNVEVIPSPANRDDQIIRDILAAQGYLPNGLPSIVRTDRGGER